MAWPTVQSHCRLFLICYLLQFCLSTLQIDLKRDERDGKNCGPIVPYMRECDALSSASPQSGYTAIYSSNTAIVTPSDSKEYRRPDPARLYPVDAHKDAEDEAVRGQTPHGGTIPLNHA